MSEFFLNVAITLAMASITTGYVFGFGALFVWFTGWLEKRFSRSTAMAVAIIVASIFASFSGAALFQVFELLTGKQS